MLGLGGIYVSPFDWDLNGLPNDPIAVDAIPDIGDNQQIIFTQWSGRSPQDVEEQITYPLTTILLGIPGVRTVRSSSAFGFSTIYVIFEDNIEFYWSRSRLLEKLASLPPSTIPEGTKPVLGPDATALGQIFWYTLEGQNSNGETVGGWDPDELRSIQDWTVRYALQAVQGVSEVASIGGYVREYQIDVDPEALRAHGVTLVQVANAIRKSNLDVGARTLEINRVEYVVRGLGFVRDIKDLESTVVVAREFTPIRIRDVAQVAIGPALRRGALDDEGAPAVGGVVVSRFQQNPLQVISAVKQKIEQIQAGLPKKVLENGVTSQVTIVPFYDRSTLIYQTLDTLSTALIQQILITIIVVLVMLGNLRSSLAICATLPLGILSTFIIMKLWGLDANIMALGGIAIAIGTMIDVAIVFVENMNQHIDRAALLDRKTIIKKASAEVAPAVFTSVLTTIVSFFPVFGLSSSELKLFAPLALTKTFAMSSALIIAICLLPGACLYIFRQHPQWTNTSKSRFWAPISTAHLRDWTLLVLGFCLIQYSYAGASIVLFMAVYRLLRPHLTKNLSKALLFTENIISILFVTILLAELWLPLGHSQGLAINLTFLSIIILLVLGTFKLFEFIYPILLSTVLKYKLIFLLLPVGIIVYGTTVWMGFNSVFGFLPQQLKDTPAANTMQETFPGLAREYMPAFDEGAYLYMPTTMPHASIGEVVDILSQMDAAIAQIPEVDRVVGKLGRVDSALDPAPVSMIETIITYKPEYKEEDGKRVRQWRNEIRSPQDIWNEIVQAAKRPGLTSAPMLMPISTRIVMLQSGMRGPMGIKIFGPTLKAIESFGLELEKILKDVPSIRPETVFADRVVAKPYIELKINREAIGRFGLSIVDVQDVLQIALGGTTLTKTVEGRERYPVRVRYMREERDSLEALKRVLVPTTSGQQIPLEQLVDINYIKGPQVIKSEDTFLTSYVLFDKKAHIAEVEAVQEAQDYIATKIESGELSVPAGISFQFAGSYQNQLRSEKYLKALIPIALLLVFVLLYLQFKKISTSIVIFIGVIVSMSGGFILLWMYAQPWFLDFSIFNTSMRDLFQVSPINLSVAVWVGFITLLGIATDDGVVISTYLDQQFAQSPANTVQQIRQRVAEAGLRRVRPCLMTTATTILALLPVITSQGRGADVMIALALPAVGGMLVELITLFVVPVLYCIIKEIQLQQNREQ